MKPLLVFVLFAAALAACTVKPEPLRYGTDNCYSCKMTLMDKRFGGEVVTTKGKVFKFDDVNCMVNFLNSGEVKERDVQFTLVTDFTQPDKLIDATTAFYLKSDNIKTPMASMVAGFETEDSYKQYKKQFDAIYLTWGELTTQFK